jgi:hypothetical protein
MRRAWVLVAVLGPAAACYDDHPLTVPSPDPGSYVAARLTEAGSVDLARYLGPDVFVVRGRYLGGSDTGLVVSVASVELKRGTEVSWAGETIVLPRDAIAGVEVRRLAKGRTALFAGAGAGGLVITTLAFSLLGSSDAVVAGGGHPGKH